VAHANASRRATARTSSGPANAAVPAQITGRPAAAMTAITATAAEA
jgi:hypothetical protein